MRVTFHPPTSTAARMWRCIWRQRRLTTVCPEEPDLNGRRALVTGGGRGIGLATSRGLQARGAGVICASRGEPAADPALDHLPLDLSDLDSVAAALDAAPALLQGRGLDIVVANAGLWPLAYDRSAQGYEIAFATNVLTCLVLECTRRWFLATGKD